MNKDQLLYEGKAKKIFATENENEYLVEYKDDATAFNAEKKGTIHDKGILNNKISAILFQVLEQKGIPTHFIKLVDDTHMIVKKVEIIPLEVIVRNVIAGSMAKRVGREEGSELIKPTVEFSYKDDSLGDPLINGYHALSLGLASQEEINTIIDYAFRINDILRAFFAEKGIILVDFKLEFGRLPNGEVILADEISPDTCRLWDAETKKKLDKDRFRRDLGDVEEAYQEIYKRIQ